MTFAPNPPSRSPRLIKVSTRARLALLLLVAILLAGVSMFRGAGLWLVRPDSPARADVLVVLSGSMPYRAEQAAILFHKGFAPEIWITRPESPAEILASLGIEYSGEEQYNRQVLLHAGVPGQAIRILPEVVENTQQEISEIVPEMRREGKSSALIVTSPEHTRRVRDLWRRLAGKNLTAIVCQAPQDPFDAAHWWRDTRDVFSVCREYLGLLNAWLGLPVRPAAPSSR